MPRCQCRGCPPCPPEMGGGWGLPRPSAILTSAEPSASRACNHVPDAHWPPHSNSCCAHGLLHTSASASCQVGARTLSVAPYKHRRPEAPHLSPLSGRVV